MENGILISGEVRTVVERKKKNGDKGVIGHMCQIEVPDFGGRGKLYDMFVWGDIPKYKKGDKIENLPVSVEISDYSGNLEFHPLLNGNEEKKRPEPQKMAIGKI